MIKLCLQLTVSLLHAISGKKNTGSKWGKSDPQHPSSTSFRNPPEQALNYLGTIISAHRSNDLGKHNGQIDRHHRHPLI